MRNSRISSIVNDSRDLTRYDIAQLYRQSITITTAAAIQVSQVVVGRFGKSLDRPTPEKGRAIVLTGVRLTVWATESLEFATEASVVDVSFFMNRKPELGGVVAATVFEDLEALVKAEQYVPIVMQKYVPPEIEFAAASLNRPAMYDEFYVPVEAVFVRPFSLVAVVKIRPVSTEAGDTFELNVGAVIDYVVEEVKPERMRQLMDAYTQIPPTRERQGSNP